MLFAPLDYEVEIKDPCWSMTCPPRWVRTRENSDRLNDLELWLVWRGRGWMRTRDREFPLLPGFCALMRPGGIYDAGQDEGQPIGITFIHFDVFSRRGRRHQLTGAALADWPEFFQLDDLDYLNGVMRRITQLVKTDRDTGAELLHALLRDLLNRRPIPREALPLHDARRQRIADMIAEIHSHPDHLPTVREMAERIGLSQAHFSRVFHEVASQSPRDFLLDTRLLRARHLLAETDFSIQEIAERLGYGDVFFFSRQFKEKIGVPPSAYRRQAPH